MSSSSGGTGVWDEARLDLKELTREQLIAHCEREAAWQRQYGRSTDDELRTRIRSLEGEVYSQGYILDKIWMPLIDLGGLKTKETETAKYAQPVISAFYRIVSRMKKAEEDLATLRAALSSGSIRTGEMPS